MKFFSFGGRGARRRNGLRMLRVIYRKFGWPGIIIVMTLIIGFAVWDSEISGSGNTGADDPDAAVEEEYDGGGEAGDNEG